MGDTAVSVYYRPPDREEEVNEAFYRQLDDHSQSQALVLMGEFKLSDTCWEGWGHAVQEVPAEHC